MPVQRKVAGMPRPFNQATAYRSLMYSLFITGSSLQIKCNFEKSKFYKNKREEFLNRYRNK